MVPRHPRAGAGWLVGVAAAAAAAAVLVCAAGLRSAEARAKRKPRTTLYIGWVGGNTNNSAVLDALQGELEARDGIDYTAIEALVRDPALPRVRAELKKAQQLLARGAKLMTNLEVAKAVKVIEQAVALEAKHFSQLVLDGKAKTHAVTLGRLAMGHFLAGDKAKCRETLLKAFVIDRKMDYDTKNFPPAMRRAFDETRFLLDELGKGKLRVATVPHGAQVRVSTRLLGRSPLTATVSATFNPVTLTRVGYRARTVSIAVPGGKTVARKRVTLEPLPGKPAQTLDTALSEARHRKPGPALARAASMLGQELLLFAWLGGSSGDITVEMFAYRAKDKRVIGHAKGLVAASAPSAGVRDIVSALLGAVARNPLVIKKRRTKKIAPSGPSLWQRMRRSRWFWPVVGAVAGAVVVGTTVGIAVGVSGGRDNRRLLLLPARTVGFGFP